MYSIRLTAFGGSWDPLDASAGSLSITGFGTKWSKVTLVPSIVGTEGSAVTYSYGAIVN